MIRRSLNNEDETTAADKKMRAADQNLSLEKMFIYNILEAKQYGWSLTKTINFLMENWHKVCLSIDEIDEKENEEEKRFRRKVRAYFDYEDFIRKMNLSDKIPKEFVMEVAVGTYKAFEKDYFDRKEVKDITLEITEILFPEVKSQSSVFMKVFSKLLDYANLITHDNQECNEFVNLYETHSKYSENVCRFVWMIDRP